MRELDLEKMPPRGVQASRQLNIGKKI